MMSIALITPTKNRPEQLNLVVDCINNQSLAADEWVIVDDGETPVSADIIGKIKIPNRYIHYKTGFRRSTCVNSAKCLEVTKADKYIFIDDDDYYPCCYVEKFSDILDKCNDNEMAGNGRWIDYRLSTGYYRIRPKTQAQVDSGEVDCMTEWHGSGIKGEHLKQEMIKVLRDAGDCAINDCICFYKIFSKNLRTCKVFDFEDWGALSLKDYGCGNPGCIPAHRSNTGMIRDDDNFSYFKSYLGEDWKRYEKYLGRLRDK